MADATQNLSNHQKFRPLFHFTTLPILLVNAIVFIVYAVRNPGGMSTWQAVVWTSLFLFAFDNRLSILTVQDRVIRDEMMARLERVLGVGARERTSGLSVDQLIGLRFASDAELPGLVDRANRGDLANRKAIKSEVKDWQSDHLRA